MSRCIVLFSTILLFSTAALPQPLTDSPGNELSPSDNASSSLSTPRRGVARTETRVSVARLKVPPKVRRLYDNAVRAVLKHKYKEARQKLDRALRMYAWFPEALTLSGALQMNEQQSAAAEENLQQAIRTDPDYSPAYAVLAGLYNSQARFDDALQAAQRAEGLDSRAWGIQYELARAWIGKREYRRALEISEDALHRKHATLLHLAKAHALAGLGNYSQAQSELQAYLRFQPLGAGAEDARTLLQQIQHVISR
jgi:tetratricopeptide (TPR) repeat protein